ncbi:hypothetical protein [Brachybacterium timonense]|uniref:hypothetical protein n=1 Tax=Brachybacterium timonense TaxID=2050896 RepID=UPI000D0AE065|nr:hypothetical protein [Brachybacterium timonense]
MSQSITEAQASEQTRRQRDAIHTALVRARPELAGRIEQGPSGALLIPLPGGRGIEIGRMRRAGRSRWVVVHPHAGRAAVSEAAGPLDASRRAMHALDEVGHRPVT